jgi:methionyl-tRNA synthetase
MDWGVKFPNVDGLVVYVWVDAPIGYIAFTEEWAKKTGNSWEKIWKKEADIVHFIGGDIVYHHCIFWPAMLKGAGYSLPTDVVASGMVKIEDHKFSKSRGYVVWVGEDYLDHGFHPDLLRYYLSSYTSHTKDLNFAWNMLQEKINSELVAVLGNLFYRSLLFASKNFGEIPKGTIHSDILEQIRKTIDEAPAVLKEYEFKQYADKVMELASFSNAYFQSNEPWALIKTDKNKCADVVYNCLQLVKSLCVLFEPIAPGKMQEAWKQLGLLGNVSDVLYDEALVPLISGSKLGVPKILFEKLEDDKIAEMDAIAKTRVNNALKAAGLLKDEETDKKKEEKENKEENKEEKKQKGEKKMEDKKDAAGTEDMVTEISIDDFFKTKIKIGKIISAETIEKSTKLYKIMVDVGEVGLRQIVSGIRAFYEIDELVGKTVCIVVNLKPAKLCGVQSQGMILAADDGKGNVRLLMPDQTLEPGSDIC